MLVVMGQLKKGEAREHSCEVKLADGCRGLGEAAGEVGWTPWFR